MKKTHSKSLQKTNEKIIDNGINYLEYVNKNINTNKEIILNNQPFEIDPELKECRYRLNQFYLKKYNNDRIKGQSSFRKNNESEMEKNPRLLNVSELVEKMIKKKDKNPVKIEQKEYIYERDLFDNKYKQRLEAFKKRTKNLNLTNAIKSMKRSNTEKDIRKNIKNLSGNLNDNSCRFCKTKKVSLTYNRKEGFNKNENKKTDDNRSCFTNRDKVKNFVRYGDFLQNIKKANNDSLIIRNNNRCCSPFISTQNDSGKEIYNLNDSIYNNKIDG